MPIVGEEDIPETLNSNQELIAQWDEVVVKARDEGIQVLKFHIDCADVLGKEANTTLNFLITGGLGALGYCAHLIELQKNAKLIWGIGAVSIYLMILAALLVRNCLSAGDVFPPYNEPKILMKPGYSWAAICEADAQKMNVRIDFNRNRNKRTGKWLNGLRYAAFAAPILFIVVWVAGVMAGA